VKNILTCNIDKSKSVYTELLKNILNTIHDKEYESDNNGERPEFNFTKDGKRIRFGFDDQMIQKTLGKYDFLKS
jgi:hypothetical protein